MKHSQILLAILLIGVGAAVGGFAGFRYAKSPSVMAWNAPRIESSVPIAGAGVKNEEVKSISFKASEKLDGGTEAPSTLQGFWQRITKAKTAENSMPNIRYLLQLEAVRSLDPSHIVEALSEVDAMKNDNERKQLQSLLFSRWGEIDPKAALAYAQGIGNAFQKREAISSVSSSWGFKDFPAAKAWVESLPPGPVRRAAMQNAIRGLARKDPATAMGVAKSLPGAEGGPMADPIILEDAHAAQEYALNAWAQKDTDAAIRYVTGLPNGDRKDQTIHRLIQTLADIDPNKAIDLAEQISTKPGFDMALGSVSFYWSQTDPNAVIDWANRQTDQDLKSQILETAFNVKKKTDLKGAFELAQSIPAAHSREVRMSQALDEMVYFGDHQSAIGLASGIADTEFRSRALKHVLNTWKSIDPAAATQWVNSSSLPQEMKNSLLRQMQIAPPEKQTIKITVEP